MVLASVSEPGVEKIQNNNEHRSSPVNPPEEDPPTLPTSESTHVSQSNIQSQGRNTAAEVGPPPPDPDQLAPADKLWTCDHDGAVKIRMEEKGLGSIKPISIPTVLVSTVTKHPNVTALAVKRGGQWQRWTYAQYFNDIKKAARSFIKLGLKRHHGVSILGFNSPEWFISDLAAIVAGGCAVGVYTTNSAEACQHVIADSKSNVCVVENDVQLQKILKIRDNCPELQAIVQYSGELKEAYPNVYTWSDFMQLGNDVTEETLIERINGQSPNTACTYIYTSGTTGPAKGVMLSHDNLVWTACSGIHDMRVGEAKENMLSFLPLSHIAAQLADIIMPLITAATVWFAQPDALKGSLKDTLVEVRPTLFVAVPRVWEKMAEGMQKLGRQTTGLKRMIASWAKGVGLKYYHYAGVGYGKPFGYTLANSLMFSRIQKAVGLDRARLYSAAAPLSKDTSEYLASVGLPIAEIYGMSENSGPHVCGDFPKIFKTGKCGTHLAGMHTKIHNPNEEGHGEICMYGRHVFMGYVGNEAKTKEAIDEDGWLHSGDMGTLDADNFVAITGRLKELLITAGGENVAPILIEEAVKHELPVISNAMLIGDRRKFLACLLTLKCKVDVETMAPKDELEAETIAWCQSLCSSATTVSQVIDENHKDVMAAIQAGVDRANSVSTSRAQKIQKWTILPQDFSIPGGELGPTMKLKRPVVMKMYEKTIDAFYVE